MVSIHAPTRGATQAKRDALTRVTVSIHAPTRGATRTGGTAYGGMAVFQSTHPHGVRPTHLCKFISNNFGFQSTHPHGVRLNLSAWLYPIFNVSIHAPTRGATTSTFALSSFATLFQSTHPHGVRRSGESVHTRLRRFQSTHPHGVRLETTPKERATRQVSIHAPTRGATITLVQKEKFIMFQSTHPHGVRPKRVEPSAQVTCFNPRTHTGCD